MGCTRINGDPRAGNWWPCTIEAQSVPRAKNKFASDGGKTLMRSLSILLTTAPVSRTFWNVLNKKLRGARNSSSRWQPPFEIMLIAQDIHRQLIFHHSKAQG